MGVEGLELGKMLGLEAILQRGEVQAVLLRDTGQLLLARIDDVEPDEGGLRELEHSPRRHPAQIRLAAAAAPNPLSMFTTVTPAAQELSIARSAASPPKEAP